jgi:hypothetical protein
MRRGSGGYVCQLLEVRNARRWYITSPSIPAGSASVVAPIPPDSTIASALTYRAGQNHSWPPPRCAHRVPATPQRGSGWPVALQGCHHKGGFPGGLGPDCAPSRASLLQLRACRWDYRSVRRLRVDQIQPQAMSEDLATNHPAGVDVGFALVSASGHPRRDSPAQR